MLKASDDLHILLQLLILQGLYHLLKINFTPKPQSLTRINQLAAMDTVYLFKNIQWSVSLQSYAACCLSSSSLLWSFSLTCSVYQEMERKKKNQDLKERFWSFRLLQRYAIPIILLPGINSVYGILSKFCK